MARPADSTRVSWPLIAAVVKPGRLCLSYPEGCFLLYGPQSKRDSTLPRYLRQPPVILLRACRVALRSGCFASPFSRSASAEHRAIVSHPTDFSALLFFPFSSNTFHREFTVACLFFVLFSDLLLLLLRLLLPICAVEHAMYVGAPLDESFWHSNLDDSRPSELRAHHFPKLYYLSQWPNKFEWRWCDGSCP